jgi:copper chaperone CopZ
MKTITLEVPAMYGDHHVTEVRRILLALPGVIDLYVSSAFHLVEVQLDENKINEDQIRTKLGESGYLDKLPMPLESGVASHLKADQSQTFFRHTQTFETMRDTVSFQQKVSYSGKPIWNCPGFGVIKNKMED